MFFRRMFQRKGSDDNGNNHNNNNAADEYDDELFYEEANGGRRTMPAERANYQRNGAVSSTPRAQRKFRNAAATKHHSASATQLQRGSGSSSTASSGSGSGTSSAAIVQLTPLWEHILRTRTIPESICPLKMYAEFLERLRDPEWQVRQHALRVLVDVLVVMRANADAYMNPLIGQLVENLGHPAPTVRKGALDCLRVYLAETAMPETIMLQLLDIGLNQKITNEPFGGRLTCGVMLSLPALVQTTLHTTKRSFILRSTIDMLVQKMVEVTHQEITLKVLAKLRDLIGEAEFRDYISHGVYREFELLCNVYGVGSSNRASANSTGTRKSTATESSKSWRFVPNYHAAESCWRSSEEEQMLECAEHLKKIKCEKVIMETEIKINDDTLTMRIVEAKDDDTDTGTEESPRKSTVNSYPNSLDDEIVCGRLVSARSSFDSADIVQLLSDSEIEEIDAQRQRSNSTPYAATVTPSTPTRTPKRVTFGGEVVKMRTPDSDAASTNNNKNNSNDNNASANQQSAIDAGGGGGEVVSETLQILSPPDCRTQALSLEIPNDNTKPLQQQLESVNVDTTAIKSSSPPALTPSTMTNSPASPARQRKDSNVSSTSVSPRSPFKRINISPVDSIISPKVQHKEIEVLHNLQRDPSPVRIRRASLRAEDDVPALQKNQDNQVTSLAAAATQPPPPPPKSWEELGIVSDDVLLDLRSGDWRFRSRGICYLEEALRSSDNLAKVQPCLDTLLRVLLSSERNAEVAEDKRRLLMNLISRLPLDNLENRTVQIMTGLCRQGGAGSNRVCKALMQRLPPAAIVLKLISDEFLHAKSSRFRENALQMVMYALMTFPSTCFDTTTCVTNATYAALNRKKRVRQAALEVLAILGQVTSPRAVIEVVQQIAAQREEGSALMTAVKMRLSRKQLPLVTTDGVVQYTLRVPSPRHGQERRSGGAASAMDVIPLDSDIEWINAGVGSVSPTSLKRRAQRHRSVSQQSFCCLPNRGQGQNVAIAAPPGTCGSNHSDEICLKQRSTRMDGTPVSNDDNQPHNIQYVLGSSVPLHFGAVSKKSSVDYTNYGNRRMVAKSCSDSSMDGKSSDSTYTTSSSGNGAAIAAGCVAANNAAAGNGGGISGRFTRGAVNSRFPTMDRMDLNATYVRVHKPQAYQPGMGAYAQLQQQQYNMNSTYPKVNYTMPQQQRKKMQQSQQQLYQQQQQQPQYHYQQQQQHYYHRNSFATQENFKQQENRYIEKCNNNNNAAAATDGNLDGTYTICTGIGNDTAANVQNPTQITNGGGNNGGRRFVNVEKLIKQSNKYSQTNGTTTANTKPATPPMPQSSTSTATTATPTSAKSTTYSQKSTATAKSQQSLTTENPTKSPDTPPASPVRVASNTTPKSTTNAKEDETNKCSTPTTTMVGSIHSACTNEEVTSESPTKWATGEEVLQLEDVLDGTISEIVDEDVIVGNGRNLQRHGSIASVQSKTESIRTQLDGTTPNLSRAQSAKSQIVEVDAIEDNTSFVMIDEVGENSAQPISKQLIKMMTPTTAEQMPLEVDDLERVATNAFGSPQLPKTPRSPTIAELRSLSRRNSVIKSMESLYERPPSKQDSLDQSTTTETSSQSSSQLNQSHEQYSIPIKPQHTPLKQKSKTSHILKSNRRISPVKRSIKMTQAELFPQTLTGFERPREALLKSFEQLDSSNWEVIIVGLKTMVRLMRYHPETLDNQMHMVGIQLTKAVRNLRSQVARAACQAATELFTIKSKYLEQECDDLVCGLLHRSADTNRFLRADASRALDSMCDNLTPTKVLNILTTKGAVHQNALVRTTAAKLLNRLVERLGCDKIFTMQRENRDKFFVTGANLLLEGSLETRSYAKSLFRQLSDHSNYNRLLIEVIPAKTYRNVEKTLKNIR